MPYKDTDEALDSPLLPPPHPQAAIGAPPTSTPRRRSVSLALALLLATAAVLLAALVGGLAGWYAHAHASSSSSSPAPAPAPSPAPSPPPFYTPPAFANAYFHSGPVDGGPPCPPSTEPSLRMAPQLFDPRSHVLEQVRADPAVAAALAKVQQDLDTLLPTQFHALLHNNLSQIPAVSVVATLGPDIVVESHCGARNPAQTGSPPPNLDTAYQVGSISKVFATLSLMRELERRHLGLADPVAAYLPTFAPPNPYSQAAVTLQALASQTSGLLREPVCDTQPTCPLAAGLTALRQTPLAFAPLSQSVYSNLGLALLGHAVAAADAAAAAGKPAAELPLPPQEAWQEYLVSQLLTPLNLTRSGFFPYPGGVLGRQPAAAVPGTWPAGTSQAAIEANMAMPASLLTPASGARPAVYQPLTPPEWSFGWSNPAGGLTSTPRDLSRLARWALSASSPAFPRSTSPLQAATVGTWLAPGFMLAGGLSGYGLGAFEHAYFNGSWVVSKGGLTGGVASELLLVPEVGLSISVFLATNMGSAPGGIAAQLAGTLLPPLRKALVRLAACAVPLPPPSQQQSLEGRWGLAAGQPALFALGAASSDWPCSMAASAPALNFADLGQLTVSSLPPADYAAVNVTAALVAAAGSERVLDGFQAAVVWGFRYSINGSHPQASIGSPDAPPACYLASAIGANALGYAVELRPDAGGPPLQRLWLPNSFGNLLIPKLG